MRDRATVLISNSSTPLLLDKILKFNYCNTWLHVIMDRILKDMLGVMETHIDFERLLEEVNNPNTISLYISIS